MLSCAEGSGVCERRRGRSTGCVKEIRSEEEWSDAGIRCELYRVFRCRYEGGSGRCLGG